MPITEQDAIDALELSNQYPDREDIAQTSAKLLKAYKSQQQGLSQPLFPEMRRREVEDYSKVRGYFTEKDTHGLDDDARKAVFSDLPNEEDRAAMFSEELLARYYGRPAKEVRRLGTQYRDQYAIEKWGEPVKTYKEFFDKQRNAYILEDDIDTRAQDAAMRRLPKVMSWFDPKSTDSKAMENQKELQQRFEETYTATNARISPYRQFVRQTVEDLKSTMDLESDGGQAKSYREFAEELLKIPKADRKFVLAAISANAGGDNGKEWLTKIGMNFERGLEDFVENIPAGQERFATMAAKSQIKNGFRINPEDVNDPEKVLDAAMSASLMDMAMSELDPISRREIEAQPVTQIPDEVKAEAMRLADVVMDGIDLRSEIRNVAENDIDPAKGEHMFSRGIYAAARSIPYTAVAMVPGGMILNGLALQEQAYQHLGQVNPDMSRNQKMLISAIAAPMMAYTERVGARVIMGKAPTLGRFLNQATVTGGSLFTRGAIRTAEGVVIEMVQENIQDATPFIVQQAIAAIKTDFPDVPWDKVYGDDFWEKQGELFFAVLPLALVGGGAGSIRDFASARETIHNRDAVTLLVGDFAKADEIRKAADAGDYDTAQTLLRKGMQEAKTDSVPFVQARAAAGEALQAHAESQANAIRKAEQSGYIPEVVPVEGGFVVKGKFIPADATAEERAAAGEALQAAAGEVVQAQANAQANASGPAAKGTQFVSPVYKTREEANLKRWEHVEEQGLELHADMIESIDFLSRAYQPDRAIGIDSTGKRRTLLDSVNEGQRTREDALGRDVAADQIDDQGNPQGQATDTDLDIEAEYGEAFNEAERKALDEDDRLASKIIIGESVTEFKEGVYRTNIKVNQGATWATIFEEKTEGDAATFIMKGKRDWLANKLFAYDAEFQKGRLVGGKKLSIFKEGVTMETATDEDLKEAYSRAAIYYLTGSMRKGQEAGFKPSQGFRSRYAQAIRAGMSPIFDPMARFFRAIALRAARLNKMRREGRLDQELERELARSVGFSEQFEYEQKAIEEGQKFKQEIDPDGVLNETAAEFDSAAEAAFENSTDASFSVIHNATGYSGDTGNLGDYNAFLRSRSLLDLNEFRVNPRSNILFRPDRLYRVVNSEGYQDFLDSGLVRPNQVGLRGHTYSHLYAAVGATGARYKGAFVIEMVPEAGQWEFVGAGYARNAAAKIDATGPVRVFRAIEDGSFEVVHDNIGDAAFLEENGQTAGQDETTFSVIQSDAVEETLTKAEALAEKVKGMTAQEVRDALDSAKLTTTKEMVAMLGEFPEYLNPVIDYIMGKRQELIDGKTSSRDLAKAYWITIASIGADAIDVSTIQKKADENGIDFNPDPMFISKGVSGQDQMRPEELGAYWLGTPDGQVALNNIEQGIFNENDWKSGLILRDAFGRNDLRDKVDKNGRYTAGAVGNFKPGQFNLRNLQDAITEVRAAKGNPAKLEKALTKINGIGEGKKGFIGHLLGFGEWATLDAVELNMWLTGKGETTYASDKDKEAAAIAKRASGKKSESKDLFGRIRKRILGLRDTASGASQIPVEVASHVIHHWIWDAGKGLETTHKGVYHAMTSYSVIKAGSKEFSAVLSDAPVITMEDLVGINVFPIIADLTAAGGLYRGIDSSEIAVPVEKHGGPFYPLLPHNKKKGLAWASQGKGVLSQKGKRANAKAYGIVTAMSQNAHVSNASVISALLETTVAYVRDGRISPEGVDFINSQITSKPGLSDFPGLASPLIENYIAPANLSFSKRADIATVLEAKASAEKGSPNVQNILDSMREESMSGLNWGDAVLVIEFDQDSEPVRLGSTTGTVVHPSYDYALKGRVVGKLPRTISYRMIWDDFFKGRRDAGSPVEGDRRAFDLSKPVQMITAEIAGRVPSGSYDSIRSPKHAAMVDDVLSNNWRDTNTAKNKGGLGPAEFIDVLSSTQAKHALDKYDLVEFKKKQKEQGLTVYGLGNHKLFFGIKNGNPASGYGLDPASFGFPQYAPTDQEITERLDLGKVKTREEAIEVIAKEKDRDKTLTLVLNNETGSKGMLSAVMVKALEEGVTALDAFAVPSKRFPDGFLPSAYREFGFEETGRVPFDPSFYTQIELADLKKFWKDTGWDESMGNPDIVLMKWGGYDGSRSEITQRYFAEGSAGFLSRGNSEPHTGTGKALRQSSGQSIEPEGRIGDSGGDSGNQGTDLRSPVLSVGLSKAADEVKGLSQVERENLGLSSSADYSFSVITNAESRIAESFNPFLRNPEKRLKIVLEAQRRAAEKARGFQEIIREARTVAQLDREQAAREGVEFGKLLEETFGADTEALRAVLPAVDRDAARSEAKSRAAKWRKEQDRGQKGIDRATLIAAMRTLDAMISALPSEIRGKIGGMVRLAQFKGPGAMLDELERRANRLDVELERWLKKEANKGVKKLFERAKPAKDESGKKRVGKAGADIHDLFETARMAWKNWDAEKAEAHAVGIEAEIAKGELSPEWEAHKLLEAELVRSFGGWNQADSVRKNHALETATEIWDRAYLEYREKKAKEKERRDGIRADLRADTGKAGKKSERSLAEMAGVKLPGRVRDFFLSLLNFEQLTKWAFGKESKWAQWFADEQRKAENAKLDAVQAVTEGVEDLFTELAGGNRFKGEQLQFRMMQRSIEATAADGDIVPLSELEAISALLMWQQEDGKRHLRGKRDENGAITSDWAYDEDFIDEISGKLSPEAWRVLGYLQQEYGKEYGPLNEVYRDIYGINLPQNANYSPLTVKPTQAAAGQTADPLTGSTVSTGSFTPGSLRSRAQVSAEPDFRDAVATFIAHKKQIEHWKAHARFVLDANAVLGNREVGNSIEAAHGQEAVKIIRKWLDAIAQGGVRDASAGTAIRGFFDRITGNAASMALVGRIGTLGVQATQLGAAAALMPTGAYVVRLGKLLSGNLGWGAALDSAYIKRRLDQQPIMVQAAMQGLKAGKPSQIKHQVRKIGSLLNGADALFTAGTYAIVYDYHFKEAMRGGMDSEGAAKYATETAERVVESVAQPTRLGTRSFLEVSSSNPFMRLAWAFASDSRKNVGLMGMSYTKGNLTDKYRATLFVVLLNGLLAGVIRSAWRDLRDDEDDEVFDEKYWSVKRLALSTSTDWLVGFPVIGEEVQRAIMNMSGEYTPDGGLLSSLSEAPAAAMNIIEGDSTNYLRDIEKLMTAIGLFSDNTAAATSVMHLVRDIYGLGENFLGSD